MDSPAESKMRSVVPENREQSCESAPPNGNTKHILWRSSFSKKAFLVTIVTVACMVAFRTKEAAWCWSNDCGYGGFRGLDFSVMQRMVAIRGGSKSPRSDFLLKVDGESTLGDDQVSGVNESQTNAVGSMRQSQGLVNTSFALDDTVGVTSLKATRESECGGKADCPGEKLCVLKACVCPVLYSGDHLCKSPTPGLAAGCFTPITSPRLDLFAKTRNISLPVQGSSMNSTRAGAQRDRTSRNLTLTQTAQKLWSNIQNLADFSTCAVVGSSSSMLKDSAHSLGAEIDGHSVVIRFNDAPTHGFEEWVGSKTTLRIQNVIYCGFREEPGEFCFRYSSKERKDGHIDLKAKNTFHCRPINGTSEMLLYAMAYWQLSSVVVEHDAYDQPAQPWDRSLRKMSAGFFGVALAAHLCGKVDVYGIESGELHYYIKSPNLKHKARSQCTLAGCKSKHSFSQRHSWKQESKCLTHVLQGSLSRLQIRT